MRGVVVYNLKKSKYIYEGGNFDFYFSSQFYMNKFKNTLLDNRDEMYHRLTGRYEIDFDCSDYFDIILYAKIEKRGFLIKDKKGGVVEWLGGITLSGEIKI